mgnify:CR=1 FL=1
MNEIIHIDLNMIRIEEEIIEKKIKGSTHTSVMASNRT